MRKSYQVECENSVSGNVTGHSRKGPLAPVGIKVDSATADNTNFHKHFVTPPQSFVYLQKNMNNIPSIMQE